VLGSFIFGLPSDGPSTFDATAALAQAAGVTFAQFVMLTPFPGTLDFAAWEKTMANDTGEACRSRHWLIPAIPAEVYTPHPRMSPDDSPTNPGRLGQVLQSAERLGTLEVKSQIATAFCADFKECAPDAPTPALPPIAPGSIDRRSGRAGSPGLAGGCLPASPADLQVPA
jgi:hypothetical protein